MRLKNGSTTQRARIVAYKRAFGTQDGKEVLFDLMNKFHILNAHDGDPYKEGQRSVVLEILSRTKLNLAAYDKLLEGETE